MEKVDYAVFKEKVDEVNDLKDQIKMYTQQDVDEKVKSALAEWRQEYKKEIESETVSEAKEEFDYKTEALKLVRQLALVNAGMDLEKAERYAKHIKAESEDEIARHAAEIVMDLEVARGVKGADPSVSTKSKWNPFQ